MMNDGLSIADALALRNDGNEGWGNNGAWWIIILFLFMFMGWGRNGFNNNDDNRINPCCTPATQQGMTDAFNFNQLDNGVRGLERGLCQGFYAQNEATNNLMAAMQNCCCETQKGMLQGFNGINTAIMQGDFHNQAGFNALGAQLQSCCCDIERGQDAIRCEVANNAKDIMIANDKNTDRIINYLTQSELDRLRTELQSANLQLSQLSQTSNIVNQLMPVAKPAYITCSPYASAFGYPYNNGCGCGCGCA